MENIKYEKIRKYDSDCHVISFYPRDGVIEPTLVDDGANSLKQLTSWDSPYYTQNDYVEVAGINGGFFDRKYDIGIVYSQVDGINNEQLKDYDNIVEVIFEEGKLKVFDTKGSEFHKNYPNAKWALQGSYRLVKGGVKNLYGSDHPAFSHYKYRHPRTMIGQAKDGQMFFVVVDGRKETSLGMNANQQATFMLELGCEVAANLDGGGSSTISYNEDVVNDPSDGAQRYISNCIKLYVKQEQGVDKPIEEEDIDLEIIQDFLSPSRYNYKSPYSMTPEMIVVHNTANDASAQSEINYMNNGDAQTSFHFAVDDKHAIQGLPLNRNGWHAGDGGSGDGNRKGIAIEICYSKSGGSRFEQAEDNGAKLVAILLEKYGWGIEKVTKHQDYSGKYCPHRTLDLGWDRFIKMVESHLKGQDSCQIELDKLQSEIDSLNKKVKTLEDKKFEIQDELIKAKSESATLSNKLETCKLEKGVALTKIEELDETIALLRFDIKQLNKEIKEKNQLISSLLKGEDEKEFAFKFSFGKYMYYMYKEKIK